MKRRAKGKTPSKEKRLERNYIIKGTVQYDKRKSKSII